MDSLKKFIEKVKERKQVEGASQSELREYILYLENFIKDHPDLIGNRCVKAYMFYIKENYRLKEDISEKREYISYLENLNE